MTVVLSIHVKYSLKIHLHKNTEIWETNEHLHTLFIKEAHPYLLFLEQHCKTLGFFSVALISSLKSLFTTANLFAS